MADYRGAAVGSFEDVSEILAKETGKIAFICGGTDLIIQLRRGLAVPDLVVDISQIPGLQTIREDEKGIHIGAAVPFSAIASHSRFKEKAGGLARAASQVGSLQIRNRGTLGGNIGGSAPAADSLPPLITLKASLTLLDRRGWRQINLADYLLEDKTEPALITQISFPLPPPGSRGAFVKVGARSTVIKAKISLAALIQAEGDEGLIRDCTLAAGALGAKAFRLEKGEEFLKNRLLTPSLAEEFAGLMAQLVEEAITGRASLPYKRVAVQGAVQDLFHALWPEKFSGEGDSE